MINGVGDMGTAITGHETIKIKFKFNGKTFIHQLHDTLYVPNAPNCLLSLSQIDDGGGSVDFSDGTCWTKDKGKRLSGKDTSITDYSCCMLGWHFLERKRLIICLPKNSLGINGTEDMGTFPYPHYKC